MPSTDALWWTECPHHWPKREKQIRVLWSRKKMAGGEGGGAGPSQHNDPGSIPAGGTPPYLGRDASRRARGTARAEDRIKSVGPHVGIKGTCHGSPDWTGLGGVDRGIAYYQVHPFLISYLAGTARTALRHLVCCAGGCSCRQHTKNTTALRVPR